MIDKCFFYIRSLQYMEIVIYYLHYLPKEFVVQIFVYVNDMGNSKIEILETVKEYIPFKSRSELEFQYNIYEKPILVILSQPSRQFEVELSEFKWHKILSHKGIRINEDKLNVSTYFETDYEFVSDIEKAIKSQWISIRDNYIQALGVLDDEDYQYLSKLAGENLNIENRIIKKNEVKGSKNYRSIDISGIITLINTVETVISLAEEISKNCKGPILVLDGDLLMPNLDEKLKVRKIHTSIKSHISGLDNTGINIALDTMAKGLNLEDYIDSIIVKKNKKIHVLLGNYNLFNYEHYDDHALKKLLIKLSDMYQVVLISVPLFPYDSMTMLALHISQINIFGIEKTISQTRYMYQYIKLLNTKQGLSVSKNLIVAKDLSHRSHRLGNLVMKDVFGESYLGSQIQKKDKLLKKIVERMK